ncbi:hypothetical protein HDU76_010655 [Blyttiomyces sp. JEL0837]|nr:hypothetical protein HDU76_010655 [Blyttiomyces sp. JEL0837]
MAKDVKDPNLARIIEKLQLDFDCIRKDKALEPHAKAQRLLDLIPNRLRGLKDPGAEYFRRRFHSGSGCNQSATIKMDGSGLTQSFIDEIDIVCDNHRSGKLKIYLTVTLENCPLCPKWISSDRSSDNVELPVDPARPTANTVDKPNLFPLITPPATPVTPGAPPVQPPVVIIPPQPPPGPPNQNPPPNGPPNPPPNPPPVCDGFVPNTRKDKARDTSIKQEGRLKRLLLCIKIEAMECVASVSFIQAHGVNASLSLGLTPLMRRGAKEGWFKTPQRNDSWMQALNHPKPCDLLNGIELPRPAAISRQSTDRKQLTTMAFHLLQGASFKCLANDPGADNVEDTLRVKVFHKFPQLNMGKYLAAGYKDSTDFFSVDNLFAKACDMFPFSNRKRKTSTECVNRILVPSTVQDVEIQLQSKRRKVVCPCGMPVEHFSRKNTSCLMYKANSELKNKVEEICGTHQDKGLLIILTWLTKGGQKAKVTQSPSYPAFCQLVKNVTKTMPVAVPKVTKGNTKKNTEPEKFTRVVSCEMAFGDSPLLKVLKEYCYKIHAIRLLGQEFFSFWILRDFDETRKKLDSSTNWEFDEPLTEPASSDEAMETNASNEFVEPLSEPAMETKAGGEFGEPLREPNASGEFGEPLIEPGSTDDVMETNSDSISGRNSSIGQASDEESNSASSIKLPEITKSLCYFIFRHIASKAPLSKKEEDGSKSKKTSGRRKQEKLSFRGVNIQREKEADVTHIGKRIGQLFYTQIRATCFNHQIPFPATKVRRLSKYLEACFEFDEREQFLRYKRALETDENAVPPQIPQWRDICSIRPDKVNELFPDSTHAGLVGHDIACLVAKLQLRFARAEEAIWPKYLCRKSKPKKPVSSDQVPEGKQAGDAGNADETEDAEGVDEETEMTENQQKTNSNLNVENSRKRLQRYKLLPICKSSIEDRREDYCFVHLMVSYEESQLQMENETSPLPTPPDYVPYGFLKVRISEILKRESTLVIRNKPMRKLIAECRRAINCRVSGKGSSEIKIAKVVKLDMAKRQSLQAFMDATAKQMQHGTFNPQSYDVPRGATRRYTPLPLSGFAPSPLGLDTRLMVQLTRITVENIDEFPPEQRPEIERIASWFMSKSMAHDEFLTAPHSLTLIVIGNYIKFLPNSVGLVGNREKREGSGKAEPLAANKDDLLDGIKHAISLDPGTDLQASVLTEKNLNESLFDNANHFKCGNLIRKNARRSSKKAARHEEDASKSHMDTGDNLDLSRPEGVVPAKKKRRKYKRERPTGRLSRCQKRKRRLHFRTGGMFDFAELPDERKAMEYTFRLKLSQYKDESWQYETEDKALRIKHRVEEKIKMSIDSINNSISSAKVIDGTPSTRYQGQQRAVAMMANRLLGPYHPSEILIVLGGAKRALSGPFEKVIKMLEKDRKVKVVRVDEYLTSQVCADCMSAQRQCLQQIKQIHCGEPTSEQVEKVKEREFFDIDHVVGTGLKSAC